LPGLVEMEQRGRSLVRGLMKQRQQQTESKPLFTSFRLGMQQLADALIAQLPAARLHVDNRVNGLRRSGARWVVESAGGSQQFDAVVLAMPAYIAADLVAPFAEQLAAELRGIDYSSSATVAMIYDRNESGRAGTTLPGGFGFLVPRGEGKDIFACTFVHNKFPHRAPSGRLILRAFLTKGLERSDDELVAAASRDFASILGLRTKPLRTLISRWPKSMPQYGLGHIERVDLIAQQELALPGLKLIGNAYRGVGIPDCVREAKKAAESLAG